MSSVSFIVPIYNKSRYLKLVLEAIKAQIGDFDKEYILIDDGSSDNSLSLIRQITKYWSNITIITQENQGPSVAVNKGIFVAKSEFIKFVDGDDILLPDATISLLNVTIANKLDIAYGKRSHHYKAGEESIAITSNVNAKIEIIKDPLKQVLQGRIRGISSFAGTSGLIKTKLLQKTLGSNEKIFIQDFSMALRCSLRGSIGFLDKEVAILADNSFAEDHLSNNIDQEAHDALLAIYYFILENKDQLEDYKKYLYQRITKIIWKLKYKKSKFSSVVSKSFINYLISKISNITLDEILQYNEKIIQEFDQSKIRKKSNL
jgi:glycosyltransferase involved in cell wall biosynthesis